MLIIDLLNIMPGGLQIMQIVEHLRAADFVRDPKPSKEVVTDDIEVLEKLGRVKRSGGKKWVLAGADKKEAKSTD